MKVLVIEDDNDIIDTINLAFRVGWPEVALVSSTDGEKGVEMVKTESPDIVILDLGLPDINGYEVLCQVREFSDVPIVILTVITEENDVIKCLEAGADGYITKPFRKMELLARIRTILRRQNPADMESPLTCGPLRYDPSMHQFYYDEKELNLTITEADILYQLMKQPGRVVDHSSMAKAVWGNDYPGAANTIKVHIRHLREKLEEDPGNPRIIMTRSGIGYSLAVPG